MKKLLRKLTPPFEFWLFLTRLLPKRLIYACAVEVLAHATTGTYKRTVVHRVTAAKCLQRYGRKYGI